MSVSSMCNYSGLGRHGSGRFESPPKAGVIKHHKNTFGSNLNVLHNQAVKFIKMVITYVRERN
jgi:hypothetical protein